ncbi:MAG: GDSL-type esterase/lipase family protein [Lachnospiraceae bacterium]|nr:GDSL-type esterase/lipase family protein [Lachnospiraceae bacterium]
MFEINLTKENSKIMGRHVIKDGTLYLSFSAAYVEFVTASSKVYASIRTDLSGHPTDEGNIGIFINGEYVKRIALDEPNKEYLIYESDKNEKVTIRIMRLSETKFGKVAIDKIICDKEIALTEYRERRIEFIGNSITCGYGVEAENELCHFTTATENPIYAFAYLTAEKLDADLNLISWSGNGILTHYIPEDINEKDDSYPLMHTVYEMQDVAGEEFIGLEKETKNDFNSFNPQIVVINIGTNDDSYVRNYEDRLQEFTDGFYKFLSMVASHRPNSKLVVTYGVMSRNVMSAEKKVVEMLKAEGVDIHFVEIEVQKGAEDGMGADYHPSKITQRKMADAVTEKIKALI